MLGEHPQESGPVFQVGESVVVTGKVAHAGDSGIVFGFLKRSSQTLYAVKFENGSVADLPAANLQPLTNSSESSS